MTKASSLMLAENILPVGLWLRPVAYIRLSLGRIRVHVLNAMGALQTQLQVVE
jgi:hypothetical protein